MRLQARQRARGGFTLLEILLASVIGGLILYGLYLAIDVQLRFADAGRNAVEQSTLARSLMARISSDVAPCVGLADPGRYTQARGQGQQTGGGAAPTQPAGGGMGGGMGGGRGGGMGGGMGGGRGGGMGGGMGGGTGGTGAGMGGGTAPGMTDPAAGMTEEPLVEEGVIDLVRAFVGDETGVTLFVSRLPKPPDNPGLTAPEDAQVTSDQRLIAYWIADGGGLARQEVPVASADTATVTLARGTAAEKDYVIAPEVVRVEFSYFDGTGWLASWDGRSLGQDGKTPKGPPTAMAVVLELEFPGTGGAQPRRRTYRQVIAIPTANGLPQQQPETTTIEP
jgi:prepilin-type N-terminal cleavage/methylation domain-containing protein